MKVASALLLAPVLLVAGLSYAPRAPAAALRAVGPAMRACTVRCCAGRPISSPSAERSAALASARPSPALQPREVIDTLLCALHRSNINSPLRSFGCAVAMRFLSPSNPASTSTLEQFEEYLALPHYAPLLDWREYEWEGDTALLKGGVEAYQQVRVRDGGSLSPWTSIRWILERVPGEAGEGEWRVQAVMMQEPDAMQREGTNGGAAPMDGPADACLSLSPSELVLAVMRALRRPDEPYALHGPEMAIRHCSPTNAASRLTPQGFSQYLREPWYQIFTEWDEISVESEPESMCDDGSVVQQDVLLKRSSDASWTIVTWQLSHHAGRWLLDSLSIT